MSKKFKVLLCIDGSQWSSAAFDFYATHLHKEGNDVTCFHCIHPPYYPGDASNVNPNVYQQAAKEAVARAEELEIQYAKKMQDHRIPGTVTARLSSDPGHEIVKKANEEQSDMVVIGTRGHGTFKRTILGSVSHHVLHHAHCPVIVCSHKQE